MNKRKITKKEDEMRINKYNRKCLRRNKMRKEEKI